jgi:FkbM family methyltransferase
VSDLGNQVKLFISSKRWMKKYFRPLMPEMAYVQVDENFKMFLSMIDISGPSFDLSYDKAKAFVGYEKADKDLVENHLKDGDVFLDIGANIGHFSFYFKQRFPDLECKLFEPIPWLGECIKNTIKENKLEKVEHFSMALSDQAGEAEFFIDTFNDGGHSLLEDKLSGRSKKGRSVKVKVLRLDDLNLTKVDFIKADVQGAEKLLVKGGIETIKKYKPKMLIEVASSESLEFYKFLQKETGLDFDIFSTERAGPLIESDLIELKDIFKSRGILDCNFLFVPKY